MVWQPSLGAWPEPGGTHFRIWAPQAQSLQVMVERDGGKAAHPLKKNADGTFDGLVAGVRPGDLYRYQVDDKGAFPDPASRFQPQGVHGPSQVIDPRAFSWSDAAWRSPGPDHLAIYELHVGTFSPAGTFAGVIEKLPYLADLGVNAIELMPLGDFAGNRNWGYDGVSIFAPAHCYGRPDDLRRLVDAAHRQGLAVLLDVVYNHFGPDGNYTGIYSRQYESERHKSPWGASLNFDGPGSNMVRAFFIENALHWLHEYHFDGLRLDATHAIVDDSPRHFLAELTSTVRASVKNRPVVLIAEDHRNLCQMTTPVSQGGWGLDGVWADDFHHEIRRLLAGDQEGYYQDYTGTVQDLAASIRLGWFFCGQVSTFLKEARGTDPANLAPAQFVICLQNHDQIGNRALGERLNHQIDPADYRAAVALLLCAPETPLLFQGQEWAAGTPFLYFTDHNEELGRLVTAGRREEFKGFAAFSDPEAMKRIPDPQAEQTFRRSCLVWDEVGKEPHAAALRLYRELLRLRRSEPALRTAGRNDFDVAAQGESAIVLQRRAAGAPALLLVCHFRRGGTVDLSSLGQEFHLRERRWQVGLTTEDASFCLDPRPVEVQLAGAAPVVRFARPGAVLLRGT